MAFSGWRHRRCAAAWKPMLERDLYVTDVPGPPRHLYLAEG